MITRSTNEGRIKSNIVGPSALAPKLTKEEIAEIDGIAAAGKQKRFVTPPWGTCIVSSLCRERTS